MRMGHIRIVIIISVLFFTTQTVFGDFSDTMQPLKDAIASGGSLPLTELPFVNMVPLPANIKKALDMVEIVAPSYTLDAGKQLAILEGAAVLFGQTVIVKVIMARGSLGASAKQPPFLKQVKEGNKTVPLDQKVDAKTLATVANDVTTETKQADAAEKKGALPTTAMVDKSQTAASANRAVLQQLAPQAEVDLPVIDKGQVTQLVDATKDKIGALSKSAVDLAKQGAGKGKTALSKAIKDQLSQLNASIFIGLPTTPTFSAIDKSLTFLDIVKFSNIMFVATTADYYDAEWDRSFRKGFNLVGTARMSGPLEKINGIIGQNLTEITIQGVINPDLFGSSLLAELPGKIRFNKYVESSGLLLRLLLVQAAVPISVSILTGLNITVPNQQQPLAFRTGLTYVPPTEFIVGGWMEGMWNNPFGVPYFSIGELGLQAGMDINTAAASLGILALSRLGMRGIMGFGNKQIEVASSISLSSASPDIMVNGKFTGGLSLSDVVDVGAAVMEEAAKEINKPISIRSQVKGKIPDLGLKNAELYIAPKDVELAGRYYKQGVMVDGVVEILGVTAELRIQVNKTTVQGLAYMSAINAGPFKITGAGKDKKRGTGDDGPILNLSVKSSAPFVELFLDGRVELDKRILGGAYGDTRVNFSVSGIEFWFKAKLFNEFLTHLEISAPEFSKPKDWKVIGIFEQEALTQFASLLEQAIKEIAESSSRDIAQAQQNIDSARNKLQSLKPAKDALDNQIRKCKGQKEITKLPQQAQIQAAIDKKVGGLQGQTTAQDIAQQINAMRKQGFTQSQLDQIEQSMWGRMVRGELQASKDIITTFQRDPALLKGFDPATQAAIQASIGQQSTNKIDAIGATIEGQTEWAIGKALQRGMPAQFVDSIREPIWKNELRNRYYQQFVNSILKYPGIDYQQMALKAYADNVRKIDAYRKTGLTPAAVATRVQNLKDLMLEGISASELLSKKYNTPAARDKYIEDIGASAMRKDLQSKLPKQPAKK